MLKWIVNKYWNWRYPEWPDDMVKEYFDKCNNKSEVGRVFKHFMELEEVPTLKQFQKIYNYWSRILEVNLDEEI